MGIRVCLAGATGWAGSALARGLFEAHDTEIVAAVSRKHAGQTLGNAIGIAGIEAPIYATAEEALGIEADVFVEYTKPEVAKQHVCTALHKGMHVVVGTSGLTEEDYDEIGVLAHKAGREVLAVGNFALTAVLLQKFAEMAAKYIPHREIIDYAGVGKRDVPSGTARELASRLSETQASHLDVPLAELQGPQESRGARLQGTQVHAVRLPGYVLSVEAIFGMPDQKLILRHEAGSSAEPYVAGALLAIREVGKRVGLYRGLDSAMDFGI